MRRERGAAKRARATSEALAGISIIGARGFGLRKTAVENAARAALAAAAPTMRGDLTVVLTKDSEIRALNRRYRKKDKPTDVLAFEIGSGETPMEPFGDVVISVETAKRQARAYRATLEDELRRLTVHGVLHLCGYDHHSRADAARMFSLARRILARGRRANT